MAVESTILLENTFEYDINLFYTLRGELDTSQNPDYPAAIKGDAYYINKAGSLGGKEVEISTLIVAKKDTPTGDDQTVGSNWHLFKPSKGKTNILNRTIEVKDFGTPFDADDFEIFDHIDNTKKLNFDLSSISTSATVTLTIPDQSGTIALNEDLTAHISDFNNPHQVTQAQIATGFTEGSIPFTNNAGILIEDNANIFWDDTLNHLGIGTTTPLKGIHIHNLLSNGDGGAQLHLSATSVENAGGYIHSLGVNSIAMIAGAEYNGQWIKRSNPMTIFTTDSAGFRVMINTGGTTGASFTPVERLRVNTTGSLGIGIFVPGTNGERVFIMGNSIKPDDSPINTVQMWAQDWNGSGTHAFFMRGEEGIEHVFGSNVGFGLINPTASLHIDQSSLTGAQPVQKLDQADLSEEFIDFIAIEATGNPVEDVGAKSLTVTKFVRVSVNGVKLYLEAGTIA